MRFTNPVGTQPGPLTGERFRIKEVFWNSVAEIQEKRKWVIVDLELPVGAVGVIGKLVGKRAYEVAWEDGTAPDPIDTGGRIPFRKARSWCLEREIRKYGELLTAR